MSKKLKWLWSALALVASNSPGVMAQDYKTSTTGGDGGVPFTMRCAAGDYLVGVAVRSGAALDAIAPLCARWDGTAKRFLPPGEGPMKGGNGGKPGKQQCDQTSVIIDLIAEPSDNRPTVVSMLAPRCAKALEPDKRTPSVTGYQHFGMGIADRADAASEPGVGTSVTVDYDYARLPHCNKGDVAVGIHGGAGQLVDRLGLICAPAPRAVSGLGKKRVTSPPVVAKGTCLSGFVWREASPTDRVCVTPEARDRTSAENASASSRVDPQGAYGPNTCKSGFVWREAFSGDLVCVTPQIRDTVRAENAAAPYRTVQ